MKPTRSAAILLAFVLAVAPRAARAQSTVTSADIQRLQDVIYDASRDVAQMRAQDPAVAADLQRELDDARDEATYFKVKLRKNERIATGDYAELRDRVEEIRARARGAEMPRRRPVPTTGRRANPDEIPIGTEFDVRLERPLSSRTARVEDRFEATTMVDLREEDGRVLVPAGSVMRGVVSFVTKATRIERTGRLKVNFDRITINRRNYPIGASVTQALESEGIAGEKGRIGIGAGAGAILGAILGGAKGALAGILIGAGGTIAATEGTDVELPAGTVLRVRLDSPLAL